MAASAQSSVQIWLSGEIASSFAAAFEGMTGEPCAVDRAAQRAIAESSLYWQQKFSGIAGALWIAAAEHDWTAAGNCVMRAAGLSEDDPAKLKSEYLEIVGQACSAIARAISGRLNREIVCEGGRESAAPSGELVWSPLQLRIGSESVQLLAGMEARLIEEFPDLPQNAPLTLDSQNAPLALDSQNAPLALDPAAGKPAFDLLLDVELPVSVSFGRAQILLKDLLKLTTGSIVELNRSIADPVEVIVNNCVIARGEVVVVDGNFGVRIQQVISRRERLRTLN